MTDKKVMQQALEALENAVRYHGIMLMADPPQDAWKYHRVEDNAKQAITSLRNALEQPVQEPTPWRDMVVVSLVREGINKHKARELADHFAAKPEQQAEPCIGTDPRCPCQDGDACHYKDCGGTKAWPVPQAEPPPEWEAINNIIAEYGLQAIDFVADWKAAQPVQERNT